MNIEDYREYCLSLGEDMEEKLPFTAFRYASGVLVFYVHGHMFSFFDCNNFFVSCERVFRPDLEARPSPQLFRRDSVLVGNLDHVRIAQRH